jgi:hypothetical protein
MANMLVVFFFYPDLLIHYYITIYKYIYIFSEKTTITKNSNNMLFFL